MPSKENKNTYRTTATIVGIVYLAGFVVGIGGNIIIQSILGAPNHLSTVFANSTVVALGAILWLLTVAGDTSHGVLMLPVLKQHSERMAFGYLAARIVDAVFIAIMVLFLLIQIPLGSEYLKATASNSAFLQSLSAVSVQASQFAYQIGMSALGVAGLLLNVMFYRTKLVPRWLAIWVLAGYAIILVGMLSSILGSGLADLSSIPGGLWEVFVGVWLIARGFNPSAFGSQAAASNTAVAPARPQPKPTNS
jgi:hypothetical protein